MPHSCADFKRDFRERTGEDREQPKRIDRRATQPGFMCRRGPVTVQDTAYAVHGGILPPSQLLFAALYINIWRHIPHTWRQTIGLHQWREVLVPYANNAYTVRKQRLHRRIKGHVPICICERGERLNKNCPWHGTWRSARRRACRRAPLRALQGP